MGSWIQTPRWYKYRKSVEPYLCLFSNLRFLQDPATRISKLTPTPNMKCHQTEQSRRMLCGRDSHIPKGVYCLLALGCEILQDFRLPKQALINAFYYVCKPITRLATAKLLHFFYITKYPTQKSAFHSAACIFFLGHI